MYFMICGKYRKFKISEIPYSFERTLVNSIVFCKCGIEDEKIFNPHMHKMDPRGAKNYIFGNRFYSDIIYSSILMLENI